MSRSRSREASLSSSPDKWARRRSSKTGDGVPQGELPRVPFSDVLNRLAAARTTSADPAQAGADRFKAPTPPGPSGAARDVAHRPRQMVAAGRGVAPAEALAQLYLDAVV